MAAGVPPPPLNSPAGSYYWLEWYTNLTNFLNGTNIPWSNINFSGSNLTDIQTRNHNDLKNIKGGNATTVSTGFAYHMLGVGSVTSAGAAKTLPVSWTVSRSSAGVYLVTHGQNIPILDFQVGATSNTVGVYVQYVTITSVNTFTVIITNVSGTATDGDFSFWCSTI